VTDEEMRAFAELFPQDVRAELRAAQWDGLIAYVDELRAENARLAHELKCAIAEQEDIIREQKAHETKMANLDEVAGRVLAVGDEIAQAKIRQLTKERDEARKIARELQGAVKAYAEELNGEPTEHLSDEAITRWDVEPKT
jgi:ribosomal protein S28E/S33